MTDLTATYDGYSNVTWNDVQDGQTVYIDNYQRGEKPLASPRISGPYTVQNACNRRLKTAFGLRYERTFIHLPHNLLVKD